MKILSLTRCYAFTLIELLLVITLIAILSTIGLTSLSTFWQKSQSQIVSSQLRNAIDLARSEAIARQEPISLLPINNHWENGFILKTTTQILRTFPVTPFQGYLYWRSFPLNQQYLTFLPEGLLDQENGTFWFCMENASQSTWSIVLNKSGRARMDDVNEKKNTLPC